MKTLFIYLLLGSLLLSQEYGVEALQESKRSYKESKRVEPQSESYIQIRYNSAKRESAKSIEKTYRLKCEKCIAKTICIYKYEGDLAIATVVQNIKEQARGVASVTLQKRHKLRAF